MRRALLLLALLSCPATLHAADKGPIRWPEVVTPTPPQPPQPPPVNGDLLLPPDQYLVVDADVECVVLASPASAFGVAKVQGPLAIPGKFVVGGKPDTLSVFNGKYIYVVQALAPDRQGEVIVWPLGGKAEDVTRRGVSSGKSPRPPTPPDPDPKPKPEPIAKGWLVVVEETADATQARGKFLSDPALASYLKGKGWKVRIADQNVVDAQGKPPADLLPYLNRARGRSLPQMYLVDQEGAVRIEGSVPATPADLLALLKTAAGDK